MNQVAKVYDEALSYFEQGQALLREAARTGDPITAMRGNALCHRAIELRWYTHAEGNILDPPWVKRSIVHVGGIRHEAPGPNLGVGDKTFYDWLNKGAKKPVPPPRSDVFQLSLWGNAL